MCPQAQTEVRSGKTTAKIAVALLLVAMGSSLQAEEQVDTSSTTTTIFELSRPLKSRWLMGSLLAAPSSDSDLQSNSNNLWPQDKFTSEIVAHATPRRQVLVERSLQLIHVKTHTHYAYDGWANLQTGYGSFFPDDSIGRSRTNGAGLVDTDWFYLKMSFKF
jgi:hypothetical protein